MSRRGTIGSVLLALAVALPAAAQELNLATTSAARPSVVAVRTGVDHALVAELGYTRVLAWGDRQLLLGADAAMPWARADVRDYRVRATAGVPLGGEHWKVAGWLSPTLRGTRNEASDMTAAGVDVRLAGGWYGRRAFAAAEAGLDWIAATHVAFSDRYRAQVYAGARDGWYRLTGGTAYVGLQAGLSFPSFDVVVRAGHPRTTALDPQTLPFYATVGLNLALPR